MNLFIQNAYAQSSTGSSSTLLGLLPMVVIFAVFYFLLIRPQQKRQKEHKQLVANIQKGDEVVTSGGFLGKISRVKDGNVSLTIADGVEIKMQASAVAQVLPKGTVKAA